MAIQDGQTLYKTSTTMRAIVRDILWLGFVPIPTILGLLPRRVRFKCTRVISEWLGTLWCRLDRRRAASVRKTLKDVFGEKLPGSELDAMAPVTFRNNVLGTLVTSILHTLTLSDMRQFVVIQGLDNLRTALAKGRGVVLLGSHFGPSPLIAVMFLQRMGFNVVSVAGWGRAMGNETGCLYNHVVEPVLFRCLRYMSVIRRTGKPKKEIVKCLRRNQVLAIMGDVLADQFFRKLQPPHVLTAKLLDVSLPLHTGPFRLAHRLSAAVVPMFMLQEPSGFKIVLEPALELSQRESADGLKCDLAVYTALLESYIVRYPAAWWWMDGSRRHRDIAARFASPLRIGGTIQD